MDIKISVRNVKLDMFVVKLDRPWVGTPFPFQGFWVRDPEEIQSLRKYCDFVYVRTDKYGKPTDGEVADVDWKDRLIKADKEIDFLPRRPINHLDTAVVEDEVMSAQSARKKIKVALDEVVEDIQRGRRLKIVVLKRL